MKKKKKPYKLIYTCILLFAVVLIGVLAFAVYKLSTEYIPQQKEAQRFEELRDIVHRTDDTDVETNDVPAGEDGSDGEPRTVETTSKGEEIPVYSLDELFGMNSDMVGWLTVPDTQIDYPVMHTPDDVEYYLHTDFDRYYSFSGCLFVGDYCDIDSDIFVIYGHNMNNGSMFGGIDMYADQNYFTLHRDIILYTRDETRLYRAFAAFPTKVYDKDDESDDFRYYNSVGEKTKTEYDKTVEAVCALSSVKSDEKPVYPAQIAYLSTCAYHEENGRFVVAAYRIA